MRFKGTFLLLIVALAFGSYLYFYEFKGSAQREKAKEAESQIWTLESKNILQMDLISPNLRISAKRTGNNDWTIDSPRILEGDSAELNRLADSASNIRRESTVESEPTDLAKFGLNPARTGLRLKTRDGKEYAIHFGINNPTGTFTYALIPGKKGVFLVTVDAASTFVKRLEDLRNHTILSFEPSEVQSLRLKNPKGNFEIVKDSDDRWWFKGIEKRTADAPQVRGLLNALSMGKISEFCDNSLEDYKNPGLDGAIIDASLIYGPDKEIKRLLIGTEKSKLLKKASAKPKTESSAADSLSASLYLAKDESRPDLFFVEKELVDKISISPNDIRDKALASFQRWDVDSMILINPHGTFHFAKSGGEWFLGTDKKKAKWDAINGLMDILEKPVKEWIDSPASYSSYGIEKPTIRIILEKGSKVLVDCSLGNAAKNGIYAYVSGDPSIKVADPEGLDLLNKSELDFVEASAKNPSQQKK